MKLSPRTKKILGWGLVVLAITVAGLLGFRYPLPPAPDELQDIFDDAVLDAGADARPEGATNLDSLVLADDLVISDDLSVGDDSTLNGTLLVVGSLDGSADLDIGTWLNLSAQTAISLTAGSTITPTGTYQPIQSGSAVTTSTSLAVAGGVETGDLLILRNLNAADAITVDGTGANVECKANIVLGPGDTLTLIWNGDDWNCLAGYDNS
jgi:hypothetical protein